MIVIALVAFADDASAVVGRPLTPLSYAGVARRTTRRAAYVGAATAPQQTTVIETMPSGCVPQQPCGGTVYQPYYQGGNVVYAP